MKDGRIESGRLTVGDVSKDVARRVHVGSSGSGKEHDDDDQGGSDVDKDEALSQESEILGLERAVATSVVRIRISLVTDQPRQTHLRNPCTMSRPTKSPNCIPVVTTKSPSRPIVHPAPTQDNRFK